MAVGLSQSAARGGITTIVVQALRMVISLGTTMVVARILSPGDFGLVAMVTSLAGLAEILRDFGLFNAAIQARSLTQGQKSNLLWLNFALGLTAAVIIYFSASAIAAFYDEPRLEQIVQLFSLTFIFNGLATQFRAEITRNLKFLQINLCEILPQLIACSVSIYLAYTGISYWALVIQHVITAFLGLILATTLSGWMPGLPSRKENMRKLMGYGSTLTGTQLLSYLVRNIDTIALGKIFGPTAVGFYDRAYQVLLLPLGQINAPLTRVAVPVLAKIQDDKIRFEAYLQRAQLVACYVTVTIFAITAALAPSIVVVLFGSNWSQSGDILRLLAVGGIFRSLMQITYWTYLAKGMTKTQLKFDLVVLPIVAACMLLGLTWGPLGVAAGHSVGYGLYWFIGLLWMGNKADVDVQPLLVNSTKSICLIAAPVAVTSYFIARQFGDPLLQTLVGALAGIFVAAIMTWAVPILRTDARKLYETFQMAVKR
ncbi:lipopolysaccharide biosynthesis protein [Pseudarthrobacter scleromae]|uniref:lipopolysaccharide biosynthesis protein n=1 Tax=Pseudarthrobacter scleromae TaxID=158897 RepID=UPI003D070564